MKDPDALINQPEFCKGMLFVALVAIFLITGGIFMYATEYQYVGKFIALTGILMAGGFGLREIILNWRNPPRFYG